MYIKDFKICRGSHVVQHLYYAGAWNTLPCKVMAHSYKSSYVSDYLIAERDKYTCYAKQWPTLTNYLRP